MVGPDYSLELSNIFHSGQVIYSFTNYVSQFHLKRTATVRTYLIFKIFFKVDILVNYREIN